MRAESVSVTRQLQATLIAFFVIVTFFLLALFVVDPPIFDAATGGVAAPVLLVPLLAFIATLVVGTVRRWRWVFWLVLVAFLGSALRLPVTALELVGVLPIEPPLWYTLARSGISAIQLAIGGWMLVLYRRGGTWAERDAGQRQS